MTRFGYLRANLTVLVDRGATHVAIIDDECWAAHVRR